MAKQLLRDQVAIVIGASSGIGRAIALNLSREGARVAIASRDPSRLQQVAREIQSAGGETLAVPTDITIHEQIDRLVKETVARWGRIDVLVASPGQYPQRRVVELTMAELEQAMSIHFYGPVYATLQVLPIMLAQKIGRIVYINTLDSKVQVPGDAPYVAPKSALAGFTGVLRQELYGTGVSVTSVLPGRVDTPFTEHLQVHWISRKLSPEAVAKSTVRGIIRRQPEIIMPRLGQVMIYISVVSPRLSDWVVRFFHLEGWKIT